MGAARPGRAAAIRCEGAAAAFGSEAARGRFRCAESLEGFGGPHALSRQHHVPRGPHPSVFGRDGDSRPFSQRPLREQRPTHPRPPFCNSNLPLKTNSEKRRKETPASSYCARAPEPCLAAPPPSGQRASRCACAQLLRNRPPRNVPVSRMCARMRTPHAPASREAGSGGRGLRALVTCRPSPAFEALGAGCCRGWARLTSARRRGEWGQAGIVAGARDGRLTRDWP